VEEESIFEFQRERKLHYYFKQVGDKLGDKFVSDLMLNATRDTMRVSNTDGLIITDVDANPVTRESFAFLSHFKRSRFYSNVFKGKKLKMSFSDLY